MNIHEYAVILTSTMTEKELLNNKHIQFEEEHNPFLEWGKIPKEITLQRAREEILNDLKLENRVAEMTLSKEKRFYQTEDFKEHFKIFAQHMKKFTCPICHHELIKKINRRTHQPIVGCTSYPSCKFIFNDESYVEVLTIAKKHNWID